MDRRLMAAAAVLLLAVAALFQAYAPAPALEARQPTPALWKIDGPRGDVYLFGSVHVLPKGMKWRRPQLEGALAQAQQLVFELDMDDVENPRVMGVLAAKYGFLESGQSLHRMLAPDHRKRVDEVARSFGLTPAEIDRMRPWFLAITLSSLAILKEATKPRKPGGPSASIEDVAGVDAQLWAWARTAGKDRGTLETAEDQIRVFADLPRDREVELLIVSLEEVTEPPESVDSMIAAWAAGDTAKLDKSFNAGMEDYPVLRDAVLRKRHEKWLPQIERMMSDGRTHFIVVGTAHLVGKDSVIAMLRAKGIRVEGP